MGKAKDLILELLQTNLDSSICDLVQGIFTFPS